MTEPAGQLAARERIDLLLDQGSFLELDKLSRRGSPGDGVITGLGTIDDRPVCVFSQDVTAFGDTMFDGSLSQVSGEKTVKVIDIALKTGCPLIGIYDGVGAGREQGVASPGLHAEILRRSARASGVIPQLSLIMGEVAGEPVFAPALSDFMIMIEQTSRLFVSGPDVIRSVTGEEVRVEEVGGGRMHTTTSGTAHYLAADQADAIAYVQDLLSYLPQNNLEDPPAYHVGGELELVEEPTEDDLALDTVIPDAPNRPYDMNEVVTRVLDDGEFCEVQALYAPNIVVGYGRIDGRSVGVVANQPLYFAGCLDINAAEKAARFIRTCDAFNTPVITFVDVPGFLPGTDQERNGIVRRAAKLIYAYAEATVPMVTVITRMAYDGAREVMGSKQLGADITLAWPTGQLVAEYGSVDALIMPHETRTEITRVLRLLRTKRETLPPKKHGNIPL